MILTIHDVDFQRILYRSCAVLVQNDALLLDKMTKQIISKNAIDNT